MLAGGKHLPGTVREGGLMCKVNGSGVSQSHHSHAAPTWHRLMAAGYIHRVAELSQS